MYNWEIVDWCAKHDFSEKVAALLSVWGPDLDELEEWDIHVFIDNIVSVNDTKYYIYNEQEALDICASVEKTLQEDIESRSDIPEYLKPYIDWKSFWENNLTIEEAIGNNCESIDFMDNTYYYAER